jgi:rod shape-determining protein MreC
VIETRLFLLRLVLVWIVLELVAATQVLTPTGERVIWFWLQSGAQPAVRAASWVGAAVVDVVGGLSNTSQLIVENRRMRRELEELDAKNLLLREDLAALRQGSELLATVVGFEGDVVVGRCMFRDPARGRLEVRAEAATEIPKDTPVIGAGGLVGRVVEVRGRRLWIQLLTHPAAATAVQTAGGTLQGLAVGTGRPGLLEIQYIPRAADLLQGVGLVTSGADGIYPAGIPVATVVSIREREGPFLEVRAAPGVEVAGLRVVLLLPAASMAPRSGGWQ